MLRSKQILKEQAKLAKLPATLEAIKTPHMIYGS